MTIDATVTAERLKKVRIAFAAATLFVLYVIKNCYDIAGAKFAASFALAALGFLLIAAGPLFKFKRSPEILAILGLAAGIAGFTLFKPTDVIPHDPQIRHVFTATGGTVKPASENPCNWLETQKGQVYVCDLIVEPAKASPASAGEDNAIATPAKPSS
jgi:hypothetical protein